MRRRQHEESDNLERWLVSYADFITLLFAFFVVLYALSSVNEGKYKVLSDSLVTAFKTLPRSLDPVQIGEINRIKKKSFVDAISHEPQVNSPQELGNDSQPSMSLRDMADEIERALQRLIEDQVVSVTETDNWLEIEINTSILFPSGSATFVRKAHPVLKEIATILAPFRNPINVEGFTDNLPIKTIAYPSNWELSAARAASVVHLFADHGVEPSRMSAIGYGQYRPIADNSTPAGRSKNRRVVIAVLSDQYVQQNSRNTSSLEGVSGSLR
jgi:chemotaxis protein MotB